MANILLLLLVALIGSATAIRSPYAPKHVQCPSAPIIRCPHDIGDISVEERQYYDARKQVADTALKAWINKVSRQSNITFSTTGVKLPTLAFSVSGGGQRSALIGAGVVQAFDDREEKETLMSGLYQAFSYESALSGGNELLGAVQRLNWPTITDLLQGLWEKTFPHAILYPQGTEKKSKATYALIAGEIRSKGQAGFNISIVDIIGRLYSYTYLGPPAGSVEFKMSDTRYLSNFTRHRVPFPTHLTVNAAEYGNNCPQKGINNTQFEMTPFEFGSWDPGVSAFVDMEYLGSMPGRSNTSCVSGFDNLGFLMATSGNSAGLSCLTKAEAQAMPEKTHNRFNVSQETLDSLVPNPFKYSTAAPGLKDFEQLRLVDGGASLMSVAIWTLLHRPFIDVILVNDNSNDTAGYPNGSAMYNTYAEAKRQGIATMPTVPLPDVFVQKGYNKRNVFFGCKDHNSTSIVYMPNVDYIFDSSNFTTSLTTTVSVPTIKRAVANGNLVATNNKTADWSACVACLVLKKSEAQLSPQCHNCFKQYCAT